jgi:hypothetical protein
MRSYVQGKTQERLNGECSCGLLVSRVRHLIQSHLPDKETGSRYTEEIFGDLEHRAFWGGGCLKSVQRDYSLMLCVSNYVPLPATSRQQSLAGSTIDEEI